MTSRRGTPRPVPSIPSSPRCTDISDWWGTPPVGNISNEDFATVAGWTAPLPAPTLLLYLHPTPPAVQQSVDNPLKWTEESLRKAATDRVAATARWSSRGNNDDT
jgi:hypothetical protein